MQGANLALLELVLELRRKYKVEPVILMPRIHRNYYDNNLALACRDSGIECYSLPFYRFHSSTRWVQYVRCLANIVCYPYVFLKMRRSFSLIHSNGSVLSLGGYLSRWLGVPHVWHLREAGALHYGTKSLPGKGYEKWVYGFGDMFLAISKSLIDYYSTTIPLEKIRLVYDGVQDVDEHLVSAHANSVFQFCMVGLVTPPKNQLDALRAVSVMVNEQHITDFHLTIVGFEEHGYIESLRAFVEEQHIGEYVTFAGERSDVPEILSNMDAGLMLSRFEAFGRVTVEYMLHGLAVVATDTGANGEIVENGRTGLLFPLGDFRQLANHMITLMQSPQMVSDFGERGRMRAMQLFTIQRNAHGVYEVYRAILDERR